MEVNWRVQFMDLHNELKQKKCNSVGEVFLIALPLQSPVKPAEPAPCSPKATGRLRLHFHPTL